MLIAENRLAKKRDFDLLMKHGRWVGGDFLVLKVLELAKIRDFFPKKEDGDKFAKQLRLAINIGLKVSKSAVKRNRAKRQVSEVVRLLLKGGKLRPGYYVLVSAKPAVLGKDYASISQEVELLLRRAGLL